ncbi:gluconate 2-dehydrogenase subunit 3 family protein [Mesorhizobium sp.]|uniref:gluconate 2-dehydrogenase subunit 3 family protein n=1 Tax=Mesorhizobium sp. TaxID=1871066 RepID=UPI00121E6D1C|nr:gluconate 2-dehydrogenase subunit 3 family protein [Mesorhizobium sp.]TIL65616.1 MAG: gluconate 2-dehydrogenase subunit 3 family protein [Mesorhizobium sp.]
MSDKDGASLWESVVANAARPPFHRDLPAGPSPDAPDLAPDPRNLFSLPYMACVEALADRLFLEKVVTLDDGSMRQLRAADARIDRYVLFRATWTPAFGERLHLALRDFNAACIEREGSHFANLSASTQDALLAALEKGDFSQSEWSVLHSQRDAFRTIYDAVCEGLFGEPGYGGNHGGIGWYYSNFKPIGT